MKIPWRPQKRSDEETGSKLNGFKVYSIWQGLRLVGFLAVLKIADLAFEKALGEVLTRYLW